jgi:hypothetical protein
MQSIAQEQQQQQQQLELFGSADRLPRRPYCSDDLSEGLRIRSLAQALSKPYIQVNPPHLRVWSIFDVDRQAAALAWEDAGLPPPTWAAINKENGHAHLVWGLRAPVLVDGMGARDAPVRYLCAIESCMRERLQADPGYSGLITKNPAHPLWRVLRGPRLGYELSELAEYLPDLDKHRPRPGVKPERVGLGRNVTLFDELRVWAYRSIRRYWGGGLEGWNAWLSACNSRALVLNAELFAGRLLHEREVWHIAKSVAKWTWRQFRPDKFSAIQAARGRLGGVAKGAANEDKRASARLMRAQGMSLRAIAAELGVPKSTVGDWCRVSG